MFLEFVREFTDGVFASLQGFISLLYLDKVQNAVEKPPNTQRESSTEPADPRRRTVLEERRRKEMAKTKERKATPSPPVIIRTKMPAYYRVGQCVAVNVLFIVIVLIIVKITELIVPAEYLYINNTIFFMRVIFLMPVFIVIRILSTLWFADVANAAYRYKGSTQTVKSSTVVFSNAAADFIHAIILEFIFLIQANLASSIPVPVFNHIVGFVLMSLLNSLYCFEYVWMNKGLSMKSRLIQVERQWPFHVGFGCILTLLTSLSDNFLINSCVFGAMFPFFIVSSFLTVLPKYQQDAPWADIHFFYIAEVLTNRVSLAVFSRLQPVTAKKQ